MPRPTDIPTYMELLERVEKLEESALPSVAVLQRKLEQGWQPDASVLLSAGSATLGLFRDLGVGVASLGFVASTDSGTSIVNHGLEVPPRGVLAISNAAPAFGRIPLCNTWAYGPTTFSINGEVKTAFTGNVNVVWIAFG